MQVCKLLAQESGSDFWILIPSTYIRALMWWVPPLSNAVETNILGAGWQPARCSQLYVPYLGRKICIFTDLQNAFIGMFNNSLLSPKENRLSFCQGTTKEDGT